MKKGTISILITAIVSACIMDSCESILTKNKLTNRKITHSFFSPLVGLPSTYMIEHADFTRQCRTRYHTSFSLDSSTSSGGDGNRKQENKRPSLFKSLRIKSLVSSPKEDNVTKQPKTDINEHDKPISTKPVRTKKESVPTAIENFQEDVSIYSNEDISTPKKVHEQSEVGDTKPTKKAKKLIPESVVVEPSSTSPTTSTGGDNDLEFFLEEGSKYIAEHSVILTPSEQHTISTKRSSMSSGNRNNNNVGGNNRKKVEIDEAKLIEIQDLIEKRFDHKYHREFDEVIGHDALHIVTPLHTCMSYRLYIRADLAFKHIHCTDTYIHTYIHVSI